MSADTWTESAIVTDVGECEKPDPGGTSTSINAGNDVCHVVRFKNIPAEV